MKGRRSLRRILENFDAEPYWGPILVRGPDGVLWDVVMGELVSNDSWVEPTVGHIVVGRQAAISGWSGPVLLEIPGAEGVVEAILTPKGRREAQAVLKITGLSKPTWIRPPR